MESRISDLIPKAGLDWAKLRGQQVLAKVGEDTIRQVVGSILCGGNVRALTEPLTRQRLAICNAALFVAFVRASQSIEELATRLPRLVEMELAQGLSDDKKLYLNSLVGLTGKAVQNVLRSDKGELTRYLAGLDQQMSNASAVCQREFGDPERLLGKVPDCFKKWPSLLYLFMGLGAQTLAIRGAEKSLYGKLFERLTLAALLQVLDFRMVPRDDTTSTSKVFWLSSRGEKRESDATLLCKPGVGARFDIGFIGPGNTEISLDKVSRYEREIERGGKTYYMATVIIVDRIGEKSRIPRLARDIGGDIVQMSMAHWPKEVALILKRRLDYSHPLAGMAASKLNAYITKKMSSVSFAALEVR